ncbi:phage tail tape measure protein [Sulfitobacter dubius]|uniref:phage tail tape measure protein n=1 Tax=Sulfitobacter dubius TaxID=218673 RepID=UPI0008DF6012|nr:phage tail tape measure protein [Sulfitobacter dubius]SFG28169.1 phage tail tape measure protein, lambda family [Sulfitobacter dubius]
MADFEDLENLEGRADGLNETLAQTSGLVSGFGGELRRMQSALSATGKDMAALEQGLSRGLRRAFDGVVFDGAKLSEVLTDLANSMIRSTYNAAMRPVTDHFGGLISEGVGGIVEGIFPFANGAPFSQGKVMPFAQGGVVTSATAFPMRGGTGVMGEAGPEAIMPLARGADGKLGVRSAGGGSTTIVMNITTPDVQGFQRSQSQIAAQVSRALSAGNRNR